MNSPESIEQGLGYLDNKRLKNIIHDIYRYKRNKNKVIFITATAVCHLSRQYGQTFLALQVWKKDTYEGEIEIKVFNFVARKLEPNTPSTFLPSLLVYGLTTLLCWLYEKQITFILLCIYIIYKNLLNFYI